MTGDTAAAEREPARERRSDMDPDWTLRLRRQEDGDFIVSVGPRSDRIHEAAVEFCTGLGGGRSPRTLAALRRLWDAMEEDARGG